MSSSSELDYQSIENEDFIPAALGTANVISDSDVNDEDDFLDYDECVQKLKTIIEESDLTGEQRASAITCTLTNHFRSMVDYCGLDASASAFPSFLNLMVEFKMHHWVGYVGSSMVHLIFNAFFDFLQELGPLVADEVRTQHVYEYYWKKAIRITSRFKPSSYLDKIEYIFKLEDLDSGEEAIKNAILAVIEELINAKECEKAMHWIIHFKLHENFLNLLPHLTFHCLNTANRPLIDRFFDEQEELREQLLMYMDNLVDFSEYINLGNKEYSPLLLKKVEYTPFELKFLQGDNKESIKDKNVKLEKTILGYARKWEISEEVIPRTLLSRAFRYIIYIHHQYLSKKTSKTSYEDMFSHMGENNRDIQVFIVDHLCKKKEYNDAYFWAYFLEIPSNQWPKIMAKNPHNADMLNKMVMEKREELEAMKIERYDDCLLKFFDNELPVVVIDNKKLFEAAVGDIRYSCEIVGIDVENRLDFMAINKKASLIQIATVNYVYLFDIQTLEAELSRDDWESFFLNIFVTEKIIKIGFSFYTDLDTLIKTFPWLEKYGETIVASTICLEHVNDQIALHDTAFNLVYPGYQTKDRPRKLAELSLQVLDVELDKSEQQSNWSRRPLHVEQKLYAAKDAYCLVVLYFELLERLKKELSEEEIDAIFNAAKILFTEEKKEKENSSPKEYKREKHPDYAITAPSQEMADVFKKINEDPSVKPTRSVRDVQIVCDNMVNNVGKELRKCGVHTTNFATRDALIEYAKDKKNVEILTMGKAFHELTTIFPQNIVLSVPFSSNGNQSLEKQIEYVLRELKIKVEEKDYFSRCMKCNSKDFVLVPGAIVRYMFMEYSMTKDYDFLPVYTWQDLKLAQEQLQKIDSLEYGGLVCEVIRATSTDDMPELITAKGENGWVDITNYLVKSASIMRGPVKISMPQFFGCWEKLMQMNGLVFHICSYCGKAIFEERKRLEEEEKIIDI